MSRVYPGFFVHYWPGNFFIIRNIYIFTKPYNNYDMRLALKAFSKS